MFEPYEEIENTYIRPKIVDIRLETIDLRSDSENMRLSTYFIVLCTLSDTILKIL